MEFGTGIVLIDGWLSFWPFLWPFPWLWAVSQTLHRAVTWDFWVARWTALLDNAGTL